MLCPLKPLVFVGTARDDIRAFGKRVSVAIGTELLAVQMGYDPTDWKPMSTIGMGVREIRTHADKAYRTIYVAKFSEAIYVLHAFAKKSRSTPKSDIQIAKDRFNYVSRQRKFTQRKNR